MAIPTWQRLIGLFIYLLPWSDALAFGNNLFLQFPFLQWISLPALPFIILQRLIPFGSLILFLGLFLGVIRNPKIPYFIRFNTFQALLITICLSLINYAFQILIRPLGIELMFGALSSTVFVVMLTLIIFTTIQCLKGNEPDLPGITQAVKAQI